MDVSMVERFFNGCFNGLSLMPYRFLKGHSCGEIQAPSFPVIKILRDQFQRLDSLAGWDVRGQFCAHLPCQQFPCDSNSISGVFSKSICANAFGPSPGHRCASHHGFESAF